MIERKNARSILLRHCTLFPRSVLTETDNAQSDLQRFSRCPAHQGGHNCFDHLEARLCIQSFSQPALTTGPSPPLYMSENFLEIFPMLRKYHFFVFTIKKIQYFYYLKIPIWIFYLPMTLAVVIIAAPAAWSQLHACAGHCHAGHCSQWVPGALMHVVQHRCNKFKFCKYLNELLKKCIFATWGT